MKAYFSPSSRSFIPEEWKDDGTYTEDTWPADSILLTQEATDTYWKQTPPEGKQLGVADGGPAWVDIPQPSAEKLAELAEQKKEALLSVATTKIVIWQTKLLMGRKLTDSETAQLNAWMDYIDTVTAADISKAPDITWPELPATL